MGLALLLVLVIAFLGISAYLGFSMTRAERVPVEEATALLGLEYQDVSFLSRVDELTLRGWLLPVEDSRRIIIMVHGDGAHRADSSIGMLDITAELVGGGYSVLMFDLRGHGESEGNRRTAGYHERRDLLGAVEYVQGQGFEHIGVLGFSMGASTALLTAAETDAIDAVVADSSFADLKDVVAPEFAKRTKMPQFFLPSLLFMVKIMYGVDFLALKPVEAVSEMDETPVFIIHGELDDIFSMEHASRLIQASRHPQSRLWIAPEAGHVRAYITYPDEYINRVLEFFDTFLK